jgi:uncharacterized membrane protein YphA (DoxX/SURF4 family)
MASLADNFVRKVYAGFVRKAYTAGAKEIDAGVSADYKFPNISSAPSPGGFLEHSNAVVIAESILRVILGWRFLISGLSNVRRWPNPVQTANLVFPKGATFFGSVATVFMIAGGAGVAVGFQTPLCSLMLILFLLPTFNVHYYWLKVLPTMVPVVKNGIKDQQAQDYFRTFDRQSHHAHEVGIRDNLVLLAAAVYFSVQGGRAFALDNFIGEWVVRLF